MEVTALCVRLLMAVFLQLAAHTQKVDADFWIIPTRLQLFEYESVSFKCLGFDRLTGWNVSRRINTDIATCGFSMWGVSTESSCSIRGAFPDDSGEYWCEATGGKRSDSVNITVIAGPVILQSPVLPVMEGEAATLRCRTRTTSSDLIADFYKDGVLFGSSFTREMIIQSVSQPDEGLYKCKISDVGESPESRLAVKAPHAETHPSSDCVFVIFRIIFPIVLMALLLGLLGLLHCGNMGVMNVFLLLCVPDQKVDSASLRVEPNKLQFFQYDSLTLHCEGLHGSTGWKFVHQFKGELTKSLTIKKTSAGLSCANKNVYPDDSGAYWCEGGWGERSNSVNITVTDGPVILESPALTVEGEAATLRCRNKMNSTVTPYYYKNGSLLESSSTGEMIIHSVSESDEGLYKCRIPGAGESPESWLDIRAPQSPAESHPIPSPDLVFIILRNICPVVLMAMLFLLLGLLHCGNLRGSRSRRVECRDRVRT